MNRLFRQLFSTLGLSLLALGAFAQTFDVDSHEVLSGDYNSDGHVDVYLKAEEKIVMIAGDIVIPILIPSDYSDIVLQSDGSGGYTVINTPDSATINGVTWSAGDHLFIVGDFTGDGYEDLFLQAIANGDDSLVISGDSSGNATFHETLDDSTFGFDLEAGSGSQTIASIVNIDGGSAWELVFSIAGNSDYIARFVNGTFMVSYPLIPQLALETVTTPGKSAYGTDVNNKLGASFAMPIAVVPGINGLQPGLSITYDSNRAADDNTTAITADNERWATNVMGHGFELAGTSFIERCRRFTTDPVDLSSDDSLCLDGRELRHINTSTSTHLSPGAEYRTRVESFSRVIAHGTSSNLYFTVETVDGRTLTYGETASSKIELGAGNTETYWAITSSVDQFGNRMDYEYNTVPANNEIYLTRISYDGAEVILRYDTRPTATQYSQTIAGNAIKRSVVLHTIKTRYFGNDVREYRMNYVADGPLNDRYNLTKIQECGYTEYGLLGECYAPLTIDWFAPGDKLVDRITDGLGAETKFTYVWGTSVSALSVPDFSVPVQDCQFFECVTANQRWSAGKIERSDGAGGYRAFEYSFFSGVSSGEFSLASLGFGGYEIIEIRDVQTDIHTYR
ncbi:MAG: SpvB/TcaC N-terminal domain-containing protein, partial [Pseudomonadota bacterium]